jgi:RNA polymerase sigma-70 factor (ECF subfamily)
MKLPANEDRDIIEGLRRGEIAAWASLCEEYGAALYRFAFHLTGGDPVLAEDIRQETFLSAADAIHGYRGEAPLFGWLCAIARRKTADEFRRRGRTERLPEDDVPPTAAGGNRLRLEDQPEEWFLRSELRAAIIEALWCLPPDYREALVARYAEGMEVEAIARKIGRSYKATESLLARARAALRVKLIEVDHA